MDSWQRLGTSVSVPRTADGGLLQDWDAVGALVDALVSVPRTADGGLLPGKGQQQRSRSCWGFSAAKRVGQTFWSVTFERNRHRGRLRIGYA